MLKNKTVSFLLAVLVSAGSVSSLGITSSANEYADDSFPQQSVNDENEDNVLTVDFSDSKTVYVDTSDMEVVHLGSSERSVSLPYSGMIQFVSNVDYALTPLFDMGTSIYLQAIYFKPSNITGGDRIRATIYAHYYGESESTYHVSPVNNGNDKTIYNGKTYKLDCGSGLVVIDKFYVQFEKCDNYAQSFDYTVSI